MQDFIEKIKGYPWRHNIKKLLFETPAEILIGVLLVGSIFGIAGYRNRSALAGEIPIAFSEVEQITRDFHKDNKPVPPLTRFYAVNNDIAMKVFESNNIALAIGKSNLVFATELRTRVDAAFQLHPLISTYADEMPKDADAALSSLDKLSTASSRLPNINAAFSQAWDESHYDVTHTHYWTTTDCDANGKNCTTTTHSEEVYDYTIHTYTYHPEIGRRAARLLSEFIEHNPDLTVNERLYLARETHAENEEAIAKSMKRKLDGKTPTADQYLKFANTWAQGSNLVKYVPRITNDYDALKSISAAWNSAAGTASSTRYITYSHSDSGPREYQVSEAEQERGGDIVQASDRILGGVQFSKEAVPALDAKIKQYVGVVLDGDEGDANQLRSDIMKLSRKIYQNNYENGFDVQPFKWLDVILITMLGMAIGGGIGFGIDRLLDAKKDEWYDPNEDASDPFVRRKRSRDASPFPIPVNIPKPQPVPDMAPPKPPVIAPQPEPTQPVNDDKPAVKDDPQPNPGWKKKYRDVAP